jgi:hypothetical protein
LEIPAQQDRRGKNKLGNNVQKGIRKKEINRAKLNGKLDKITGTLTGQTNLQNWGWLRI